MRIASFPGFRGTRARVLRRLWPPTRLACNCRPSETKGIGTDWLEILSSQNRLGGCKESKRYYRNLETAWCGCSRESHGQKTPRAGTKVPRALPECEDNQNRKWNGTARSYRRLLARRAWLG